MKAGRQALDVARIESSPGSCGFAFLVINVEREFLAGGTGFAILVALAMPH